MNEPLEQLQFTEEEIDHAVRAFTSEIGYTTVAAADIVRAVLRAVRAVPARCLNGHLSGEPATVGTKVRGTGLGGAWIQGEVVESYPVTTIVRAPDGRTDYLWTNTIRSWDPSTEKEIIIGPPNTGKGRMVVQPVPHFYGDRDRLRADDDGMPCEEGR